MTQHLPKTYIPLVYVAGPYSAPTEEGRDTNIQEAWTLGCQVATLGALPVVPHMNTAHMDALQDQQWWLDATLELMLRCDAVIMLPSWPRSHGATNERAVALKVGLPVFETMPELAEWVAASLVEDADIVGEES